MRFKALYLSVVIVFLSVFVANLGHSDEVHKHDGSILKGKIIEVIPDEIYRIELADGSVLVVKHKDVAKVIFSSEAEVQWKKYHIGIQGGYFKAVSEDLKSDVTDLTNAGFGSFNFRYSLKSSIDLVLDAKSWFSGDSGDINFGGIYFETFELETRNLFLGFGVRGSITHLIVKPFIQGNIYFVKGVVRGFGKEDYTDIGFGMSGGVEVKITKLISVPLEVTFLTASSGEGKLKKGDLSGVGISTGVNFNF